MLNKLLHYLKTDKDEFAFQFQSHPNYPSALAFSDTLNFLGVKNESYSLEKEYWEELNNGFIVVYQNNFALVKKVGVNYKVFSDDVKTISKEDLYKNSTDFVLLFEEEENTKTKEKFIFNYVIFAILVFLFLYSFWFFRWYETLFNLLSTIGLYISLELFNNKFGKESVALNNICGASQKKTQENCAKIINSDKINIFGLKLSDFSLVYFISILILGIVLPASSFALKILAATSSLVILYSLYIQIFVEQAICKICLLIASILILQITISEIYFSDLFGLNTLFLCVLVFSIVFISLIFINNLLMQKDVLTKSNIKILRFIRNYELFKRELLEKEKINFTDNFSGFYIGNKNAKLHISLISNPYCGYCKEAHNILDKLLKKYPEDISAQIRFNYFEDNVKSEYTELVQLLNATYQTENPQFFLNLLENWFTNGDLKKLKVQIKTKESKISHDSLIEIANENVELQFTFTPIFLVNGYRFPNKYDREDIFYFIDDMLEDEEILNEI
jgi:uncharacterized membrane protein/thiol-disulfide isomerase/thioredoxin